jgi:hypothetical protein
MILHPRPALKNDNFSVKVVVDGDSSSSSVLATLPMVKNTPQRSSLQLPEPKKQVSFHPFTEVYPVLHINDYLLSEVQTVWYSKSELQTIRDDCRRTVTAMMVVMTKDGRLCACGEDSYYYYCTRGLEHRTIQGIQHKRHCRVAAWDAVLDEQDFQNKHGVSDPERIAYLYHLTCSKSIELAQQMALL